MTKNVVAYFLTHGVQVMTSAEAHLNAFTYYKLVNSGISMSFTDKLLKLLFGIVLSLLISCKHIHLPSS